MAARAFDARKLIPIAAGLLLVGLQVQNDWLGVTVRSVGADPFQPGRKIETTLLDADYALRAWLFPSGRVRKDLVLVAIDDDAIVYQRKNYKMNWLFWADLVEKVSSAKPRAIFFDMDLSKPNPVGPYLEDFRKFRDEVAASRALPAARQAELDALTDQIDFGGKLADALKSGPIVLPVDCMPDTAIPYVQDEATKFQDSVASKMEPIEPVAGIEPKQSLRLDMPRPEFATAVDEIAQSCEFTDSDQRLRRDATVISTMFDGRPQWLPSAAIVMAERTLGLPRGSIRVEEGRVVVGDDHVPIDERGLTMISYAGPGGEWRRRATQGSPDYYGAADLLGDPALLERLADKTVFIGLAGLVNQYDAADAKATPFSWASNRTPGVEKIAVQTDALLRQVYLARRPPWFRWQCVLTALLAAFGAFAGLRMAPRGALVGIAVGGLALLFGGAACFTWGGLWIDTGFPMLSWCSTVAIGAGLRYMAQEGEKRYLREAFSKYLDPKMVDRLLANKELKLFGEERELTVLFADLRGFTSTSERATPAEVVALLNDHLSAMSDVIRRHGGTLDKFIGDCVMAFWGAPIDDAQHAQHACDAAVDMLTTMDRQNQERRAAGKPTVDMGVGINSGKVVVGNMGSHDRFDYTVIGDAVNLASRLEGLTKVSPSRVLIGERTAELAGKEFAFVALGAEKVKGKAEPVKIYGLDATMRQQEQRARA